MEYIFEHDWRLQACSKMYSIVHDFYRICRIFQEQIFWINTVEECFCGMLPRSFQVINSTRKLNCTKTHSTMCDIKGLFRRFQEHIFQNILGEMLSCPFVRVVSFVWMKCCFFVIDKMITKTSIVHAANALIKSCFVILAGVWVIKETSQINFICSNWVRIAFKFLINLWK